MLVQSRLWLASRGQARTPIKDLPTREDVPHEALGVKAGAISTTTTTTTTTTSTTIEGTLMAKAYSSECLRQILERVEMGFLRRCSKFDKGWSQLYNSPPPHPNLQIHLVDVIKRMSRQ